MDAMSYFQALSASIMKLTTRQSLSATLTTTGQPSTMMRQSGCVRAQMVPVTVLYSVYR